MHAGAGSDPRRYRIAGSAGGVGRSSALRTADFKIEMNSRLFGLEVTDAGNASQQRAMTELEKATPGSLLDGNVVREPGEPLQGLAAAIQAWHGEQPASARRFSRISVLRDRVLMYDVTASAFLLPVPASPSLPPLFPLTRLDVSEEDLRAFCRRHRIRKLGFFGSVLGERFGPQSDVDVLVEFEPSHRIGLIRLADVELQLSRLLRRKADLRTVPDLSRYFREEVVREKTDLAYAHVTG